METSSGIQIETHNDYSLKTTPILSVNNPIQVTVESEKYTPYTQNTAIDKDRETEDFQFLANPVKLIPKDSVIPPIDNRGTRGDLETDNISVDYKPRYEPNDLNSQQSHPQEAIFNNVGNFVQNSGFFASVKASVMTEDEIRRQKSSLLHQYESKNSNCRYSPKILTMTNSLDEIKNELEYINSKRDLDNNMTTWKDGMFLFLNSAVQLNNVYDPFDVDLSNWLRDTHYDLMKKGKYDEVLEQLIIKWRGKMPIPPELQLIGMLGMSLAGGVMAQKREKQDRARRLREEKILEQKVQSSVQAEMKKMQKQWQQGSFQNQYQTQQTQSQTQSQPPSQPQYQPQQKNVSLNGPNISDKELLELIRPDFLDSTIGGMDTESNITIDEEIEDQEQEQELVPVVPPKKKRGRPANPLKAVSSTKSRAKKEDLGNVMTIPFL